MVSKTANSNGVLFESDVETPDLALAKAPVQETGDEKWDTVYVWHIIIYFPILYLVGLYGCYVFLVLAKWQTDVFAVFLYVASILGVTAGAHRLWSHRAYKAKWPLQLILMIFQTLSLQYSALNWVRDHRMHHKYVDTDADPHNATRGFFFSHIGWLMMEKHPEYERKVKGLDLSDVENNPILRFQKTYYYVILIPLIGFLLPTAIPVYIWNETWTNAFLVAICFRLTLASNSTQLINSAAHKWGYKPYDKNMLASEVMLVSLLMLGEGFHNYHHAFPWDYKAGELSDGMYYAILVSLICFILPTAIPVYIWNETWTNAVLIAVFLRITCSANSTGLINSAAHKWGYRPYDKNMLASESMLVSLLMLGEGFHNYHHAFPWDYKAGELSGEVLNFTTTFIDFFARIGWAYDLKTISDDIIQKRVMRTGDGSHHISRSGDKDQSNQYKDYPKRDAAIIINTKDN